MEKIYLWENDVPAFDNEIEQDKPNIRLFLKEGAKSLVIICPGGAYIVKVDQHEGIDIAEYLNSINVSAMVLDYRVKPYKYPIPQYDAKRAIRYARYYAEKLGYDKDKIGIMGFSAGGHLAASMGTIWDDLEYEPQDEIDKESGRADFMILCYPVISLDAHTHIGTRMAHLGDVLSREAEKLSLASRVTKDSSPAFVWHTLNDEVVPVENSLEFAAAMARNSVSCELHVYKNGVHGTGLGNGNNCQLNEDVARWTKELEIWMKDMGYIY